MTKEQLALDLTLVYLSNRFGIDVSGNISTSGGTDNIDVTGEVCTSHLPDTDEINYRRVGTGQKGFLGIEKKATIEDGKKVDYIFRDMVSEYYKAYNHFLTILNNMDVN